MTSGNTIRKIDGNTLKISTIANASRAKGFSGDGGNALYAKFNMGYGGMVTDSAGNLYITDGNNNAIRRIDAKTNIVSTIAGNPSRSDPAGDFGVGAGDGGLAINATFTQPSGITMDASGNIYFLDNIRFVRKIQAATGIITTIAGDTSYRSRTPRLDTASSEPATSAQIFTSLIAIDKSGNLYIGDEYNVIKKISNGIITRITGGYGTEARGSGNGGPAKNATYGGISGFTFDDVGNMYISDEFNSQIRRIDAQTNIVSNYAGSGNGMFYQSGGPYGGQNGGVGGYTGDGGPAKQAEMYYPAGIVVDNEENVLVADVGNCVIRKIGGLTATSFFAQPETPGFINLLNLTSAAPMVNQAVTPNGDGRNDVLVIDNIQNYPNNTMRIINDSGAIVYQTQGYNNNTKAFDGHSSITGKLQQPGTYYYSLDYTANGQTTHKTGYIVLKY